jgi:hypothetical protein
MRDYFGTIKIEIPWESVGYDNSFTREQIEEIVTIAARRSLLAIIENIEFKPLGRTASFNVEVEGPTLSCSCGGCVGTQTCDES